MQLTAEERQKIMMEEQERFRVRRQLGSSIPRTVYTATVPSDGIAALLSFLVPGAGQMYKGAVGHGIAWLILTPIGYLMLLVPGILLHVACIWHAVSMRPVIRAHSTSQTLWKCGSCHKPVNIAMTKFCQSCGTPIRRN
jgi:TM2 domain-containing membrane protein YozV